MCPFAEDYVPFYGAFVNFTQGKHSNVVRKIRKDLTHFLQGRKTSPFIAGYFANPTEERYPLYFKPVADDTVWLPTERKPTLIKRGDKYYLYGNKGGWDSTWSETELDSKVVSEVLAKAGIDVSSERELLQDTCYDDLYEEVAVKVAHTLPIMAPFAIDDRDPLQVAEYKKIINALYYLEVLFRDLEYYGISAFVSYFNTDNRMRNHLKKAAELLNIGLNFANVFGDEIQEGSNLLWLSYQKAQGAFAMFNHLTGHLDNSVPYQAGFAAGVAVDQMNPDGQGNFDYDFLTNFSAVLPNYIHQVTDYFKKYTNETADGQTLSEQKIKELKAEGAQLLAAIEKSQSGGSFGVFNVLNYVHLVGHIIHLSQDILGQTGLLNDATQELIRERMHELKHTIAPHVFEVADKIEIEFMLTPGTLTDSLMQSLTYLYEAWAVNYTRTLGNFDEKEASLLKLNDADLVRHRVKHIQHKMNLLQEKQEQIYLAQQGYQRFFDILSECDNQQSLSALPADMKQDLIDQFQLFRPFLHQIDKQQEQWILTGLTTVRSGSWIDYSGWVSYVASAFSVKDPTRIDQIMTTLAPRLVAAPSSLQRHLSRSVESLDLQIRLNKDMIRHIEHDTSQVLFPYHHSNNVLTISEKSVLKAERITHEQIQIESTPQGDFVQNRDELTLDEVRALYHYYQNKREDMEKALAAREELLQGLSTWLENQEIIFDDTQEADKALKAKCLRCYTQIQPYFMALDSSEQSRKFDKALIRLFSGNFLNKAPERRTCIITRRALYEHWSHAALEQLAVKRDDYAARERTYQALFQDLMTQSLQNEPLFREKSAHGRDEYLVKHTEGSKQLKAVRAIITECTGALASPLQERLMQEDTGVPFPEIESWEGELSEKGETLSLKLLLNFFYYTEQLLLQVEKIGENETSFAETTAINVVGCVPLVYSMYTIGGKLASDPYFHEIYQDVMSKLKPTVNSVLQHTSPYIVGADQVAPEPGVPAKYSGLWYTLNALTLLPSHINELVEQQDIDADEKARRVKAIQEATKKANMRIERIIAHANSSYGKLLLDLPIAYPLYQELLTKLQAFTDTSNAAVVGNIKEIKTVLINGFEMELDALEQKLGLKAGLLVTPISDTLDEFFNGLVSALDFDFTKEDQLVGDISTIQARRNKMLEFYYDACAQYQPLMVRQSYLQTFFDRLGCHIPDESMGFEDEFFFTEHIRPAMGEFKAYCMTQKINFPELDIDPRSTIFETKADLERCKVFLSHMMRHNQGLVDAYELKMQMAEEKLHYLSALKSERIQSNEAFHQRYAEQYFDRTLTKYCKRNLGLLHLNKEYSEALRKYVSSLKNELVAMAVNDPQIDVALDAAIALRVEEFETNHIKTYYQFDDVIAAIYDYKQYLVHADSSNRRRNNPRQNQQLDKKDKFLGELEELINNTDGKHPVLEERFDALKTHIKNNGSIITLYASSDSSSVFKQIKQWFLELFLALGLHSSRRQQHFKRITQAMNTKPDLHALKEQFGLLIDEDGAVTVATETTLTETASQVSVVDSDDAMIASVVGREDVDPEFDEPELDEDMYADAAEVRTIPITDIFQLSEQQLDVIQANFALHYPEEVGHTIARSRQFLLGMHIWANDIPANKWIDFTRNDRVRHLLQQRIGAFHATDTPQEIARQLRQYQQNVLHPLIAELEVYEITQGDLQCTGSTLLKKKIDEFIKEFCDDLNVDWETCKQLSIDVSHMQSQRQCLLQHLDDDLTILASYRKKQQVLSRFRDAAQAYEDSYYDQEKVRTAIARCYEEVKNDLIDFVQEEKQKSFLRKISFNDSDTTYYQIGGILYNLELIFDDYSAFLDEQMEPTQARLNVIHQKMANHHQMEQSTAKKESDLKRSYHQRIIHSRMQQIVKRPLGMTSLQDEYTQFLKDKLTHVLQRKKWMFPEMAELVSADAASIEDVMSHVVKKVDNRYLAHYKQLDKVLSALNDLHHYYDTTGDVRKRALINELLRIACNDSLSAQQRITDIQARVQQDAQTDLLIFDNQSTTGFAYMIDLVLSLLETLQLYTPPDEEKLAKQVSSSLEQTSGFATMAKSFGLFYDKESATGSDTVCDEDLEEGERSEHSADSDNRPR